MNLNKEFTMNRVLENKEVSTGIYKIKVSGKFKANPGQFYMIRCWEDEPVLSRPISVHNVGKNGDYIEFLYAVVGKGTELISKLNQGDEIKTMGPLGNGFNVEEVKGKKIAIVAGGIGIAPMKYLLSLLKEENIDLYAGFKDLTYAIEDMKNIIKKIYVSTEDGSCGHKGYITDILNTNKYDLVLCCGPEVMMNKVVKMCKETNTKVYISEEKKMACGIGACLVCTCKTKQGNKRTCKDGPVFCGDDIEI
ncbi:dihydroorotate dehydrogenase electron transfer subunit [Clostridium senegalense]|uniref:dihydroorotate dehydrogenase electron transfer subunit n=1 Tax=Clostridium senegalense TaxID=1465809 RepID=UPI000289D63E|nr:dihydroorotate dehydrogenase electron transfer subunit [Clostridium senegalense]